MTTLSAFPLSAAITALLIGLTQPARSLSTAPSPTPVMDTVTPDRLSAVIGQKYRLRFSDGIGSPSAEVDESGTRLVGGGRFDVVLFGFPHRVHGMACEVTQVDQQQTADLLGDCARVAAGDRGAPVVASWIDSHLHAPAMPPTLTPTTPTAPTTTIGTTQYALRAIPTSRTWVLSMSPDGS